MNEQDQTPKPEAVTFLEFSFSASSHPFIVASMGGGRAVMEELIPRGGETYTEYFTVVGVEPKAVMDVMEARTAVEVRLLNRHEENGLFEFTVDETCPVVFLCLVGAVPRLIESIDGQGRITAEVCSLTDPTTLVRRFRSEYPDAELVVKRQQSNLLAWDPHAFSPTEEDLLTDRQHEVLKAAFEKGYYDWSRETTGEEITTSIGISPATFHQHRRTAERYLVEWFLTNRTSPGSDEANRRKLLEQ